MKYRLYGSNLRFKVGVHNRQRMMKLERKHQYYIQDKKRLADDNAHIRNAIRIERHQIKMLKN